MPYKRPETGLKKPWVGQVRINGKKKTKTFTTRKEAKTWEVSAQKGVVSLSTLTVSLGEWAIKYLMDCEARFVRKTFQEKRAVFELFFKKFDKDKPVDDFSVTNAADYLREQFNSRSGNAANRDRKNLAAAWSWGVKYLEDFPEAHRKPNPFLAVEKFPEQRLIRYVPPVEDFWKVYEKTTREQDKVMLLTFLHLGARRNEIFRLKWEDVDFFSRTVGLYTRKTRNGSWEYERLPMTDDLYEALRKLHKGHDGECVFVDPETDRPFTSRQHWLKKICMKAGVKPFGMHAIRHLTACILADSGASMIDIQYILRHKSLATTERYIRRLKPLNRKVLGMLPGANKKPTNEPTTIKKRGNERT